MRKSTEIALSYEGYIEKETNAQLEDFKANAGDKNYTRFAALLDSIDFYNGHKQAVAWCDVFVDCCFVEAYGKDMALALTFQPRNSKDNCGAGCKYSRRYYKSKGRLFDTPEVDDQVFFWPSDRSDPEAVTHTGLVYNVDDKFVYTVEGNTSGGAVCKKKYALNYYRLAGFGRPDWKLLENPKETEQEEKPMQIMTVTASNGKTVNLRKSPSTTASLVCRVPIHDVVEADEAQDGWRRVEYKGQSGYMMAKYLQFSDELLPDEDSETFEEMVVRRLDELTRLVNDHIAQGVG